MEQVMVALIDGLLGDHYLGEHLSYLLWGLDLILVIVHVLIHVVPILSTFVSFLPGPHQGVWVGK